MLVARAHSARRGAWCVYACREWGCLRVLRAWGRLGLVRLPPDGSRHLHDRTLTRPPTGLPASQEQHTLESSSSVCLVTHWRTRPYRSSEFFWAVGSSTKPGRDCQRTVVVVDNIALLDKVIDLMLRRYRSVYKIYDPVWPLKAISE